MCTGPERRILPVVFLSVSLLLAGCPAAPPPDSLYESAAPELPIALVTDVALTSADERPVPLRIFFPVGDEVYPLIVLSHGTFSSPERYDRIASYWAAHGYVVILPRHMDAEYGVQPTGYEAMQNVTLSRVDDMSLVLDGLPAIEAAIPGLAGRIARGQYIAAGHSIGTQVAMLVTGLVYRPGFEAEVMRSEENRFIALVLISDPGKMRLMPEDLWLGSGVPTFMATGTDDYGLMGERGPATETQSSFESNPASVDRYQLLLQGGDHYFGGLIQKDRDTPSDYAGLEIFNRLSLAFMDAYAGEEAAARRYLQDVDLATLTGGRATLQRYANGNN